MSAKLKSLYRKLDHLIDMRARNFMDKPGFEAPRTKLRNAIAREEERAKPAHRKGAARA